VIATFHHRDFDLRSLRRLKSTRQATISCVVPTLNEAATIHRVVSALRASPLVDELLVVDSGSTDRTRELAAEAGATVHLASRIRPELGPATGKGENMWKSLFVTRGEILVFVDGDLRNPHRRFVHGLVGPLLVRPELRYIKAFYERPGGGGRVTEILARPLLRRFFPELAGVRQPLAGEIAARRELLEALPFPVGYSVETTHLIDIARRFGPGVIAQTDLDRRVHRSRPLAELGRTSEDILASVMSRIDRRHSGRTEDAGPERPPKSSMHI
jgi:glucosyl-3-phosphoglycerate synthase